MQVAKFVGGYGESELEFQRKRLSCLKHIDESFNVKFNFAPLCPEYMVAEEMSPTAVSEMSGNALGASVDSWQQTIADPKVVRYGELAIMTMSVSDENALKTMEELVASIEAGEKDFTTLPSPEQKGADAMLPMPSKISSFPLKVVCVFIAFLPSRKRF